MTEAQLTKAKELKASQATEINKIRILKDFLKCSAVNITTPNNSNLIYNLNETQLTAIVDDLLEHHTNKIRQLNSEFEEL